MLKFILLFLLMLLLSAFLSSPAHSFITGDDLAGQMETLNADIVAFYQDAIDWAIESAFIYLGWMAASVLAIKVFKG